jgi:nitroimidazol reductase NimA-like FMN-containing flavoprotein (pyridoxamine 5'-phosphate oxidase superfamily)
MVQDVQLREIAREDCLALLAGTSVGRLAFVDGDWPVILPVNYAVDGETIVFRTDPGLKLATVPLRKVAFEVDDVDPDTGTGWSVLVRGHTFEITRAIDRRSTIRLDLPVHPFAPGEKGHWIQIEADEITGRRLVPAEPEHH